MKMSELSSTYIQLSCSTSIDAKGENTYNCESISNIKRLPHPWVQINQRIVVLTASCTLGEANSGEVSN